MEMQIRELPAIRVAALRHIGPYPEIGQAFQKVCQWGFVRGIQPEGAIGMYYDNPRETPASELRSDACIPVPDGTAIQGDGLREERVKAGRYAVTTHVGPYSTIGESWGRFMGEVLPRSGNIQADGPCLEIYIDDCSKVPAERLRTELLIPIAG